MREIKFRAWNHEHRSMVYFDLHDCNYDDIAHMPLMRFTGLRDENGKEIFEGDLVTIGADKECDPVQISSYIDGEGFGHFGWNAGGFSMDSGMSIEIVGNIYENPELFKV